MPQQDPRTPLTSSLSALSDASDLSSLSSISSKATTPVDVDSSKETGPRKPFQPRPSREVPRRRYDVRPKVSIPPDLTPHEFAMQCVAAAESSRLNPYALHRDEYHMLRGHISHTQVTTYLNLRNAIVRLWIRNVQIAVTREEAIGCAKDTRWFDVASVCFDWLVRYGYVNYGCVEIRPSRKHQGGNSLEPTKRRRVVVIGAGMSGLGCARQLVALFTQYRQKLQDQGEESPEVVVLEGRNRVGGRVYSRALQSKPRRPADFQGERCTVEMGGMIITGFDRGNPMNVLVRGQLGLPYHNLRPDATIYDTSGKAVDRHRDDLVEKLFNVCLERVSEYKFKLSASKVIEGNRELMEEGRDSSAEGHKTIQHVEETTAAQPKALSVSQQNVAPQVDLVPVSSNRATGRVHMEPGTPGAHKAGYKAKLIGWALKAGVSEEDDIDLEPATREPGATLGSVTDYAISQYRNIVDLNALDYRLLNWHVANLEYSNAINYHQLSLQGWDIDAGNEWEGKHTMVVGGYQCVPRGLLHFPTTLDIRQKSIVKRIIYASNDLDGQATVECEDGSSIDADYVVSTIPLGVLKHGNVQFDPPLPSFKSSAIQRLGFGVLNKVILVYEKPFWDETRDIFGVLRMPTNRNSLDQKDYTRNRGRFFQWFNLTEPSGLPVLLALMAGDAGLDTEQTCNDDLVAEATDVLRSVFGQDVPNPVESIITRWSSDKFARGSYSSAGPDMKATDYEAMAAPVGNLYFAGEHTTGTHPATVHGAYLSGLRAASEVAEAILGPIEIPTPLILPKGSSASNKRKAPIDPVAAAQEAYEIATWDHIVEQIGLRPQKPAKPCINAYTFYSKVNYEAARQRCETRRRPGKGSRASANEVRGMTSKMWKETSPAERAPFEAMAEASKTAHTAEMEVFNRAAATWDKEATELRLKYEREHPNPAVEMALSAAERTARRTRMKVDSYADADASDLEMAG